MEAIQDTIITSDVAAEFENQKQRILAAGFRISAACWVEEDHAHVSSVELFKGCFGHPQASISIHAGQRELRFDHHKGIINPLHPTTKGNAMNSEYDERQHDAYLAAWRAGNDAGMGYPIGLEEQTPAEAVAWEIKERHYDSGSPEGEGLHALATMEGGAVLASMDGRLVVVADANGPWAVDV